MKTASVGAAARRVVTLAAALTITVGALDGAAASTLTTKRKLATTEQTTRSPSQPGSYCPTNELNVSKSRATDEHVHVIVGDPGQPCVIALYVAGPVAKPAPARRPVAIRRTATHRKTKSAPKARKAVHRSAPVRKTPAATRVGAAALVVVPDGNRYAHRSNGYDISWPQCKGGFPARPFAIALVGASDGRSFTLNPCLGTEVDWAGGQVELYLNINSPVASNWATVTGPNGHCSARNLRCMAYNYGYNDAIETLRATAQKRVSSRFWWIDVETVGSCSSAFPTGSGGYWSCNPALNSLTIQGALDAFAAKRLTAGVYSTAYQWQVITGGYVPRRRPLPTWIAGVQGNTWPTCRSTPFAGARPWMVQLLKPTGIDVDHAC